RAARALAPGIGTRLARPRHQMEGPQQRARPAVVAANVLGRRLFDEPRIAVAAARLAAAVAADDDDVVDDNRAGEREERRVFRRVAVQADAAVIAEAGHRLAGPRVDLVEVLAAHDQDARVLAVVPDLGAARALARRLFHRRVGRLLRPHVAAARGVERLEQ